MSGYGRNGGVIVIGQPELSRRFRQLAAHHMEDARRCAEEMADVALGNAVDRAPIDVGTLVNDIESVVELDGQEVTAIIRVPLNAPSSEYAVPMHENDYQPGSKSLDKQSRTGVVVGKGYIRRGVQDGAEDYEAIIMENLTL